MISRLNWFGASGLSLLVAFILTAVPLPDWMEVWRPEWVVVTMVYWCLAMPERVGVFVAWGVGLLLDVLQGSILGQHALGLATVGYLAVLYHQRIRVFPLVQQSLVVGSMVFVYLGATALIYNLLGSRHYGLDYLLGAITSACIWPWVYVVLRDFRRKTVTSTR
ncbi:MAG: rod shape-determining protein MreD [Gammaproteobacteria bacterium]|nr:rod shape-determining protein MreD [Gammaproteobacteria bacterium]